MTPFEHLHRQAFARWSQSVLRVASLQISGITTVTDTLMTSLVSQIGSNFGNSRYDPLLSTNFRITNISAKIKSRSESVSKWTDFKRWVATMARRLQWQARSRWNWFLNTICGLLYLGCKNHAKIAAQITEHWNLSDQYSVFTSTCNTWCVLVHASCQLQTRSFDSYTSTLHLSMKTKM